MARNTDRSSEPSYGLRVEPRAPAVGEFRFWDEAWFRRGKDGRVRVGAMLPRSQGTAVAGVHLPRIGEVVYQGLPLANAVIEGSLPFTVPAAISGVVVSVNNLLEECLSVLWNAPCESGWIACISPSRLEEEARNCKPRRVVLANGDKTSTREQYERLTFLGCRVGVAEGVGEVGPMLEDPDWTVVVLDEASFGDDGPALVGCINTATPSVRIVVIGSAGSRWEAAYREHRIFYYAVEPFADNEVVDILDAVFRLRTQPLPHVEHHKAPSKPVSRICITNRNGKKIGLLAASGLLREHDGLGWQIGKLLDRLYPIETALGNVGMTPIEISKAAGTCDHLLVLLARDVGRLPGSLVCDTTGEFLSTSRENASRVTPWIVQPNSLDIGPKEFDDRTTAALAEQIVREMTLC